MYSRECVSCGAGFETSNYLKKKCRNNCKPEREPVFVGVDGEGVDRPDGRHEYVMLSVGDQTLFDDGRMLVPSSIFRFLYDCFTSRPEAIYVGFFLGYDFIQWERNLPRDVAWSLLTKEGIVKRKSNVQGGSPYPDPVVYEGWEFDVLAGRRWKLRPHVHIRGKWSTGCRNRTCTFEFSPAVGSDGIGEPRWLPVGESLFDPSQSVVCDFEGHSFWETFAVPDVSDEVSRNTHTWMYICDTGPFWQQAFLKVIDPKNWGDDPICSEVEYETVRKGKADRGTLAAYDDTTYAAEMARYNVLENAILARVTSRLDRGFRNKYIPIRIGAKDWYGPGRAAQLWMDQLAARTRDKERVIENRSILRKSERKNEYTIANADVYSEMPEWAQVAVQATYYGGWFEQFIHGHVGTVYEYDINSAYPAVIASLPCLHTTGAHNGSWTRGTSRDDIPPTSYAVIHARVSGSNPYIGAMPFRDIHGNIFRPNNVEGWYWKHELDAAVRAGVAARYDVVEWVAYDPCTACNYPAPFNPPDIGIERMYNLRLQVGKNTPQGKGFKLVYNSAYGKTAQSIGNPKYSNPLYASLITAGCRVQILEAIASHPLGTMAVSMVATDGVYFTSPHPSLELSPTKLGAWDEQVKHGMTQLMPGVYWDDEARDRVQRGGTPYLKSRGVNARDLSAKIERLDHEFQSLLEDLIYGREIVWPALSFEVGFLLDSALSSLRRGKWEQAGRVQHGSIRTIDSNPHSKRAVETVYRDGSLIRTRPYPSAPYPSVGYDKTFGYEEFVISQQESDSISLDGRPELSWFRDLLLDG